MEVGSEESFHGETREVAHGGGETLESEHRGRHSGVGVLTGRWTGAGDSDSFCLRVSRRHGVMLGPGRHLAAPKRPDSVSRLYTILHVCVMVLYFSLSITQVGWARTETYKQRPTRTREPEA